MTRMIKILLLIGVMILVSAVTIVGDSMDLNNKLIATTIGVDKKDGEIWFYVEFANIEASKNGSDKAGNSAQYILVKSHGKTFDEARMNLNRQLDKPIYIGGVRTLLITEQLAQEDLVEYLYRIRADSAYRKKVITITTRDDLDVLYKTINDQGRSVGYTVENTVDTLSKNGDCCLRTTSRQLENLSDPYTGSIIPCIGLQDEEVAFMGYSIIYDTRSVGVLPVTECAGLNMIMTQKAKTYYTVPYHDLELSVVTTRMKRLIKAEYQDGRASFTFSLCFDASIEYGNKKTPYGLNDEDMKQISELVEQMIYQDLYIAFEQTQDVYKTDYLQCDDAFRVKYPALFKSMNWEDVFEQAELKACVLVNLTSVHIIDYSGTVSR